MTKNTATNYDAGHRWKSHADFYLICLPYNCKLYLFKHVHMDRPMFLYLYECVCVCVLCVVVCWLALGSQLGIHEIGIKPAHVACCLYVHQHVACSLHAHVNTRPLSEHKEKFSDCPLEQLWMMAWRVFLASNSSSIHRAAASSVPVHKLLLFYYYYYYLMCSFCNEIIKRAINQLTFSSEVKAVSAREPTALALV